MDILAVQMPGLYADHGESGWYNEDIWRQLEPCPYDPMGEHQYGPTFSVGAGMTFSAGEKKNYIGAGNGGGCGNNIIPKQPNSSEN